MPHLMMDISELDVAYPRLEPPEDLQLDDLERLECDSLYQKGMTVVQGILNEMTTQGRLRKPCASGDHAVGGSCPSGDSNNSRRL